MRCGHDQEMRRSSGKKDDSLGAGLAAAKEIGSPPSGGKSGSAEDGADVSPPTDCESRFGSGVFSGSSSKGFIVFQCGVSSASRKPGRRRRAEEAARGGR